MPMFIHFPDEYLRIFMQVLQQTSTNYTPAQYFNSQQNGDKYVSLCHGVKAKFLITF